MGKLENIYLYFFNLERVVLGCNKYFRFQSLAEYVSDSLRKLVHLYHVII